MNTRERILEVAQTLAQSRGFNAFSYADISDAVGIRKASIHHHFPAKEDLERELVLRYRANFRVLLDTIDRDSRTVAERLEGYFALYRATLDDGAICLCGMMASDIAALPEVLREPLQDFFDDQIEWLAVTLNEGVRRKEWPLPKSSALQRAKSILATLQGGLMIARATNDPVFLDFLTADLLQQLQR
jgi:TetR/AcrR family transcriptional repressor of nem operon